MKIDSKKLNLALAKKCMSMSELSTASGVDAVTITRINKGTQSPRPQTVGKLAKALNVRVEELIEN